LYHGARFVAISCTPTIEYDTVVRNGTIVDGSGSPGYVGDG
jgi:hypothetical protein